MGALLNEEKPKRQENKIECVNIYWLLVEKNSYGRHFGDNWGNQNVDRVLFNVMELMFSLRYDK